MLAMSLTYTIACRYSVAAVAVSQTRTTMPICGCLQVPCSAVPCDQRGVRDAARGLP